MQIPSTRQPGTSTLANSLLAAHTTFDLKIHFSTMPMDKVCLCNYVVVVWEIIRYYQMPDLFFIILFIHNIYNHFQTSSLPY